MERDREASEKTKLTEVRVDLFGGVELRRLGTEVEHSSMEDVALEDSARRSLLGSPVPRHSLPRSGLEPIVSLFPLHVTSPMSTIQRGIRHHL